MYIDIITMSFCCDSSKSNKVLQQVTDFTRIISEKNRIRILCLLKEGDLCVCEIWQKLKISQNLTSHHLKTLKDFGLVKSKNISTNVIYSLNRKKLSEYTKLFKLFIE